MRTVFTTDDVNDRDRFDYWHEASRQAIIDHDSVPHSRNTFQAELRVGTIGALELAAFRNARMSVSHTARHLSRSDADQIFLCRQVRAPFTLDQGGRQVVLAPGEVTLVDPALPYEGWYADGSEMLVLKLPRRRLESRIGSVRGLGACRPATAEGRLLSDYLALLAGRSEDKSDILGPSAERLVEEHLLDLVALCFGQAEAVPRGSSARSLVRQRVRAAIEAGLSDPALDAVAVAHAAGISVRYANAVLADEGTSLMHLVQERRLARCRQALEDPAQRHRSVSEIAFGWGFSDLTHFGRRFKAAFGLLPSACRPETRTA